MPRRLYDDFVLKRVDIKPSKPGSGKTGDRKYAVFGCPHCGDEIEVVESLISNKKASVCGAHLQKCTVYKDFVAAKEPQSATVETLSKDMQEIERRHEERHSELMNELKRSRECLTAIREWGGLDPPENTYVDQLKLRDRAREQQLEEEKRKEIHNKTATYKLNAKVAADYLSHDRRRAI